MNNNNNFRCWLCDSRTLVLKRRGISPESLKSSHFTVTDSDYGTSLSIYQCQSCGFLFCPEAQAIDSYYAAMTDVTYEETQEPRSYQAQKLLEEIRHFKFEGKLLDIGAGIGILVKEGLNQGYDASGIEVCEWFVERAKSKGLPVYSGSFPGAAVNRHYDIITLIDVLEHVENPVQLMTDISQYLTSDGIAVIVTPDVSSLAARLFNKKWWHYRIAHLSYFNRKTLRLAADKSNLEIIKWKRPSWYFSMDYLLKRLNNYLPFIERLSRLECFKRWVIPLNLRDSWMIIARKK
ncbi:class I SAM-dependent methyltransferase [Legionella quinlivanii]|uniref:class I SAM-dependent methyltransferase n=1 Tax=Legionella quinlivanii TaxID=45073 RepID=UPI002243053D|nr:class I SAM-dependent methyltransferase [Legionella quinlivanii]MCW8450394.1 class I SAM-dependent methyltransferase [Legionella quinlivanii]